MKKVFYFDVETTGTDATVHDIHQLAYIVEVDNTVVLESELKIRPFNMETCEDEALQVSGVDRDTVASYPHPLDVKKQIDADLCTVVDKYDPTDKMYPAGFNVGFDLSFLSAFFKKCDDNYLGSFLNWKALDPLPYLRLACFYDVPFIEEMENLKLSTACEYFGIDINAHDALSDIRATRLLLHRITSLIKIGNYEPEIQNNTQGDERLDRLLHAARSSNR